jgi:hypothetical protein
MDQIPWPTLIEAGPLYFVIGLLTALLFRAYTATDALRAEIGKTLDGTQNAIEMLRVALASCSEVVKENGRKLDTLIARRVRE